MAIAFPSAGAIARFWRRYLLGQWKGDWKGTMFPPRRRLSAALPDFLTRYPRIKGARPCRAATIGVGFRRDLSLPLGFGGANLHDGGPGEPGPPPLEECT